MLWKIARGLFYVYAALAVFCLIYGALVLWAPGEPWVKPELAINILGVGLPWSFLALFLISGKEPTFLVFLLLGVIPLGLNAYILWLLQRWLGRRAA